MSSYKNDPIIYGDNQDDNPDLSWQSLNSVQIDFIEMERQHQKIVILAEDASQKIDTLSNAVSSLTTSAESSYEIGGSCVDKIKNINTNISEKMLDQMNKMQELNEETKILLSNMVNSLLYAYVPETDENGNVLYDDDGNIVYKKDAEGDLVQKNVYKFTVDGEEINYNQLLKQNQILKQNANGDQTIYDEEAYNAGKSNMSSLESKLTTQEQWDRLGEMYLYFKDKGLTDEQIAGVLGNATLESGLILDIKNPNSTAKGLFQWINGTITTSEGVVESNQPSAWDLTTQLDHVWHQIEVKPDKNGVTVLEHLNNTSTDVSGSANNFQIYFEGCSDASYIRSSYANAIYSYIKDNFY